MRPLLSTVVPILIMTALLQVASDPAENELVAASCGESLAQIFVRSGRLDPAWLQELTKAASNEVIAWVQ